MIIEKLMKQTDFTKVEKSIADYLMKNGFDVKNMSIQTLAHETFTSPSTCLLYTSPSPRDTR